MRWTLCLLMVAGCGIPDEPSPRNDLAADAGPGRDAGPAADAGPGRDAGPSGDAGQATDAGPGRDAGPSGDAGQATDAGPSGDAGQATDAGAPSSAPTLTRFGAAPELVERGDSVVLSWKVDGATRLRIDPGLGEVTGSQVTLRPEATTTYTLTAQGQDKSVTATAKVTVTEPRPAWAPLSVASEAPGGYQSDVYRWLDSKGALRAAVLTRNTGVDPGSTRGGMLRQLRYTSGTQERVVTGTGIQGSNNVLWNGWGYVVSHYGKNNAQVARSADVLGQYRQVFVGRHHALHEFTWTLTIEGVSIPVTVHWFFATGHDHPLYAITFDSSAAPSAGLASKADSRAPYGDIAWDGEGTQAVVDGVKWGDKYKFFSRDEPLTSQSRWDYTQPNTVPYTSVYSRTADAEMGIVQTLSWVQHNAGGTWLHTNWNHTSENRAESDSFGDWTMPPNWNWPYQLCQYEMPTNQTTTSKRVAWGLMAGAVGQPTFWGYGYEKQESSLPYQSYSVYMVLGRPSENSVQTQVTEVERLLKVEPYASLGRVVEQGAGGVGRSDSVRYAVAGYNGVYGVHEFKADTSGGFTVSLTASGGELHDPILLIRDIDALPPRLWWDGVPLKADVDYFASYEAGARRLWLTVHRTWSGKHTVSTQSPP